MPPMASIILRASREAARAARSAASAASRCATAAAARSLSFCFYRRCGCGGLESSDRAQSSSSSSPHRCITGGPVHALPHLRRRRRYWQWIQRRHTTTLRDMADAPLPLPTKCREEFVAEEKDLESDEALWALYERWCKYFNEERDRDEMARRFSKFKKTVLRVQRNKKPGLPYTLEIKKPGLPYTLEINYLADGKLIELYRPKVPIWKYVRRMPYSDSVIYGRPPDFLFSEGHKFLSQKKNEGHN